MKLVLLTDLHYGVRGDRDVFLDNHKRFLDNIFFPYLHEHAKEIDGVIVLGDLVDRRKYININTMRRLQTDFLEPLSEFKASVGYINPVEVYFIAGNHDVYFRNTNEVNTLDGLLDIYGNVVTHDVVHHPFPRINVAMVPWICDANRESVLKALDTSKADVVLGHFGFTGFEMHRGNISTQGDDPKLLSKFDLVCSGHYHHRSRIGNIQYIGAFGEYTWSDHTDPRGFAVLETSTRALTFVNNPYTMFEKIEYTPGSVFRADIANKFVKLVIREEDEKLEHFISSIETCAPVELQIIRSIDTSLTQVLEEASLIDATLETFHSVIDSMDPDVSKEALKRLVSELYSEALFN